MDDTTTSKLRDVLPNLAAADSADPNLTYTKAWGDGVQGPALCVERTNLKNLLLRKFRVVVSFTVRVLATTLRNHVPHVIGMSTGQQMCGVYAGWVITAMQDVGTVGDGSVGQFVSDPMGRYEEASYAYAPVALSETRTGPYPTIARLINLRPEAVGQWYTSHVSTPYPSIGHTQAVSAALGFVVPNYTINGGK